MDIAPSERLSRIEAIQGTMANDIADIKRDIHGITESALPRHEANIRNVELDRRLQEFQAQIGLCVESKEYQIAHDSLIQRVAQLETNPQRLLAWVSMGISAIGCLITLASVALAFLVGVGAIWVNLIK